MASSDILHSLVLSAPEPTGEELLVHTLEYTHELSIDGLVFEGTFIGTALEHPLIHAVVRLAVERGVLDQLSLEQLAWDEAQLT